MALGWQLAAAVAPSLIGMMQRRPSMPGFGYAAPDRESYVRQILSTGFNPQDEIYQLAMDKALSGVNTNLARSGLAGSSLYGQMQSMTAADLANKFLEGELNRRRLALDSAVQYDRSRLGPAEAAYNAQIAGYRDEMGRGSAMLGGIGNILGAVGQHYGQEQARQERAADRQLFRDIYGLPQLGVPGG